MYVAVVVFIGVMTMCGCVTAEGMDGVHIIPRPIEVKKVEGEFRFTSNTRIVCGEDEQVLAIGRMLAEKINRATGYSLEAVTRSEYSNETIFLELSAKADERLGSEGYRLKVRDSKISIAARS